MSAMEVSEMFFIGVSERNQSHPLVFLTLKF